MNTSTPKDFDLNDIIILKDPESSCRYCDTDGDIIRMPHGYKSDSLVKMSFTTPEPIKILDAYGLYSDLGKTCSRIVNIVKILSATGNIVIDAWKEDNHGKMG